MLMSLLSHPSFVHNTEEQSRALERLTDGLREALEGVYLPSELRSLVQATEADRQGRVPQAPGQTARPQHPHAIHTGYRCADEAAGTS